MTKHPFLFSHRGRALLGLALGLTVLAGTSGRAQNLLKNGDFEIAPIGAGNPATNWSVGYIKGGPDDWEIKDRSRGGERRPSAFYGGYFRVISQKRCHAYFTQTVTNLTPGHTYNFVVHMQEDWWKAPNDALRDKYLVWAEVIGGQGEPLECGEGRSSVTAVNNLTDSVGNSDANIDAPYTYPTIIWRPFYAQQTPDANGKIEVRLHYNKVDFTIYDKTWTSAASYDDCSLTP
jgi:hypothetical protein